MKVNYKGFELEAKREKCLGGYSLLYYTAYRIEDGWGMIDSFTEGEDTEKEYIGILKNHVDCFYEHPEDYEEDF